MTIQHMSIWKLAKRIALAGVAIVVVSFIFYPHAYITTPSMYPTIKPGAMVFIKAESNYKVGDVVEFHGNGLLWIHRIVAIKPNGQIVTKGDNPQSKIDVFVPPRTIHNIVGKVVLVVPFLGFPQVILNSPSYGLAWLQSELSVWAKIAVVGLVLFFSLGKPKRSLPETDSISESEFEELITKSSLNQSANMAKSNSTKI